MFAGDGAEVDTIAEPPAVVEVVSHPDVNYAGEASFFGDGAQAVSCTERTVPRCSPTRGRR